MHAPSVRRAIRGLAGAVLLAVVAGACSGGTTPAPATAAPPATTPTAGAPSSTGSTGLVETMATTSLGAVLTGPNGLTLYSHAGDTATSSTCTGGCASAWPPLAVAAGSTATAGPGVTGTLGTLTRADGTTQVTYNGLPLYGWQGDAKPGDVTGQGIADFSVALAAGAAPTPSASASAKSHY